MDFLDPAIDAYAENISSPEVDYLQELNRETHLKVLYPRMLSGHLQGRILSMISKMIKPQRILEIGTYTGYSALCLAEGLAHEGKLITIDINAELKDMVEKYALKAGFEDKIDMRIGNAMDLIPDMQESWDLVFLDADKGNYVNYFDLVIDHVRPGGMILADNVLWSGRVLDESLKDKETAGLRNFNRHIANNDKVEQVLLPVRDGIMVIRKK